VVRALAAGGGGGGLAVVLGAGEGDAAAVPDPWRRGGGAVDLRGPLEGAGARVKFDGSDGIATLDTVTRHHPILADLRLVRTRIHLVYT
jgi:hypothetical protein